MYVVPITVVDWRGRRNRGLVAVHRALFSASGGRLLGRLAGMPVVMITTRGHATGKRRRTMLTVPVREGARLVLVASNGGNPRHPDWFVNLRACAQVDVMAGGRTTPMTATVASAEEAARLWPDVVAAYRGYAAYRKRSPREIPLVLLDPAPPSATET